MTTRSKLIGIAALVAASCASPVFGQDVQSRQDEDADYIAAYDSHARVRQQVADEMEAYADPAKRKERVSEMAEWLFGYQKTRRTDDITRELTAANNAYNAAKKSGNTEEIGNQREAIVGLLNDAFRRNSHVTDVGVYARAFNAAVEGNFFVTNEGIGRLEFDGVHYSTVTAFSEEGPVYVFAVGNEGTRDFNDRIAAHMKD